MNNNIIGYISSFQNKLNNLFISTGFFLKSKIIKSSHKGKSNTLFYFWVLFFKMNFFGVVTFFLS